MRRGNKGGKARQGMSGQQTADAGGGGVRSEGWGLIRTDKGEKRE